DSGRIAICCSGRKGETAGGWGSWLGPFKNERAWRTGMRTSQQVVPSEWTPLHIAAFRAIWFASLAANVGTWFQNVGGVWLMSRFTASPLLIALMQTATTLPVFLVGFPAGALADIVNRRLLVRVVAILAQRPGLRVALVFGILVVVLLVLDKHGVS